MDISTSTPISIYPITSIGYCICCYSNVSRTKCACIRLSVTRTDSWWKNAHRSFAISFISSLNRSADIDFWFDHACCSWFPCICTFLYSYFKDRIDYLSETIVEELLFSHAVLHADEFPFCLGKRKKRIKARWKYIDSQQRIDVFPHLTAFLPAQNKCFKNLVYLRPKTKYIFHGVWSFCLLDLRRAGTL